jgi:Rab GDP dissociation inhibitor
MEFISAKKIYVHNNDKFLSVPCTKSEIFLSEDIELKEKQKLLNFIYAVMKIKNKFDVNTTVDLKKDNEVEGKILEDLLLNIHSPVDDFLNQRFSPKLQEIIKFVLANLDPNLPIGKMSMDELIGKIYKYLISLQVYDDSPFLYPLYGSSEFSQALSRVSAVYGTIFIVNDPISCIVEENKEKFINQEAKKFVVAVNDSSNKKILIYF